ncbi:5-methyltetrahydrofolate--homocysteine methyltransferase, partial [bacterium]
MKKITDILKNKVLILDGATGTELSRRGMPAGVCPELWALKNPSIIKAVHADYIKAGSDIVYTCTFGANKLKLKGYGAVNVKDVNRRLALLARNAIGSKAILAGDMSSTGHFVKPFGPLEFEEAVDIFKEQARGLLSGGVDIFVIETMMDIQEARAALIAVKEVTDKFVMVTMTYEKDGRTINGTDPLTALITLQSLGADAVGANCSAGPEGMLNIIKTISPYAKVPLVAKPNAGMPKLKDAKTVFEMGPAEFSSLAPKFIFSGVSLIGGCCGTTPEHIRALKNKILRLKPVLPALGSLSALTSSRKTVFIKDDKSVLIIGERINPTGKKQMQQEFLNGNFSSCRALALEQEQKGALVLDVNVGVPRIDEKSALVKAAQLLSVTSSLPLSLDSSEP